MILCWYYTRRVWFFWYELDSASMLEISWLVCALMLTWWRSLTSWVLNSAVGWGGEVRPEPIDWIVIGGIMTRALKDQWISISIASMSLIGLFWLELAVWWFPSSRGHHTTCHDGTKIHAYCGLSVISAAPSFPWWARQATSDCLLEKSQCLCRCIGCAALQRAWILNRSNLISFRPSLFCLWAIILLFCVLQCCEP